MAKGVYAVVSSKAQKVKNFYAVVGGTAKKIKKLYSVVGGITKEIFSSVAGITKGLYQGVFACYNARDNSTLLGMIYNVSSNRATTLVNENYEYISYVKAVSEDGAYIYFANSSDALKVSKWNGTKYVSYCTLDKSVFSSKYDFGYYSLPASGGGIATFSPKGEYLFILCNAATSGSTNFYVYNFIFKNNGSSFVFEKAVCISSKICSYHQDTLSGVFSRDGRVCACYVGGYDDSNHNYRSNYCAIFYDANGTGDYSQLMFSYVANDSRYMPNITSDADGNYFVGFTLPYDDESSTSYSGRVYLVKNGTVTTLITDGIGYGNYYYRGLGCTDDGHVYVGRGSNLYSYSFNGSSCTEIGTLSSAYNACDLIDINMSGTLAITNTDYWSGTYTPARIYNMTRNSTGVVTAMTQKYQFSYSSDGGYCVPVGYPIYFVDRNLTV